MGHKNSKFERTTITIDGLKLPSSQYTNISKGISDLSNTPAIVNPDFPELTYGMGIRECGVGLTGPQKEGCFGQALFYNEGNYVPTAPKIDPTANFDGLWQSLDSTNTKVPCACNKAVLENVFKN